MVKVSYDCLDKVCRVPERPMRMPISGCCNTVGSACWDFGVSGFRLCRVSVLYSFHTKLHGDADMLMDIETEIWIEMGWIKL